jgi:hypothetical protein
MKDGGTMVWMGDASCVLSPRCDALLTLSLDQSAPIDGRVREILCHIEQELRPARGLLRIRQGLRGLAIEPRQLPAMYLSREKLDGGRSPRALGLRGDDVPDDSCA